MHNESVLVKAKAMKDPSNSDLGRTICQKELQLRQYLNALERPQGKSLRPPRWLRQRGDDPVRTKNLEKIAGH